ncbi:SMP-30/gluconolactonase/LRE family protein [Modicisalibacter luteus]|uniref:SMP-30/gluconolactonase/LRE family protein n=1 Tax=Modicisalibacter luteus TaxID=453962 RepID=UPI00364477C0
MTETVHCAWPGRAQLGEGPLWSTEHQALLFVDIRGSRLLAHFPAEGTTRDWPLEEACCWLVPHAQGGFVAGLRSRLVRMTLNADGPKIVETLAAPWPASLGNASTMARPTRPDGCGSAPWTIANRKPMGASIVSTARV